MQGESGLFIYCKEAVSLQGFSRGACPHHYLSSYTCPPAKPPSFKLHPVMEDGRQRERKRDSPYVAVSRVLFFPHLELKMGGKPRSASASATRKTSRLLMPKKCLLNPRQPCNCAVQPVKIRNCLLLVYSACLPLIPHAFLTSSKSARTFCFLCLILPLPLHLFLFVRNDVWLRQKHGT